MACKNKFMSIIISILLILIYCVSILPYSFRVALLVVLLVLFLLSPILGGKKRFFMKSIHIIWLLTFGIIAISMLRIKWDQFYILFYLSMILLLLLSDDNINWMLLFMKAAMILGAIYAFFTIVQVVAGGFYVSKLYPLLQYNATFDPLRYMRFGIYSGFTYQTAVNALYLSIGIGSTFCSLLYEKKGKIWKISLIAIEIICIMLASKRGHLIFSTLALLVVAYYSGSRGKRSRNILIAAFVVFAIFVVSYATIPAVGYFFDRITNTGGDITNGRSIYYKEAFELFKEHPLFGIGWEGFRYTYKRYTDVHNIYLQLLCETGLIGTGVFMAAFISMIVLTVKKINILTVKAKKSFNRYLLLFALFCQVFFLLYGFTGNPLYDYYVVAVYFLGNAISLRCPLKMEVRTK